jgi:uncharacterized phage infection (PIP) family protein YhgE
MTKDLDWLLEQQRKLEKENNQLKKQNQELKEKIREINDKLKKTSIENRYGMGESWEIIMFDDLEMSLDDFLKAIIKELNSLVEGGT